MRCRKVRSFLSAYCRDELPGKQASAILAHLEGCPECRLEETAYRELNMAMGDLPGYSVSDDFNSRLLKRVADERFKEVRSKAYMPKRIPVVTFNRLAPILAAACFVFAFVFSGGMEKLLDKNDVPSAIVSTELDNSYMTAQPEDWAFRKQVARATRIKGLMNRLSGQNSFGTLASQTTSRYSLPTIFRMQPLPLYQATTNHSVPESVMVRGEDSR